MSEGVRITDLTMPSQRDATRAEFKAKRETVEEAQRKRRQALAEHVARERERLTEEDRVLAETIRVPTDRPSRVALAHKLRNIGSRQRTYREIAAIFGDVRMGAIAWYFIDPDDEAGQAAKAESAKRRTGPRQRGPVVSPSREHALSPPDDPLAARLARRRRGLKISQTKLCQELGIDLETYRTWERGEANPGPAVYAQLAERLGL